METSRADYIHSITEWRRTRLHHINREKKEQLKAFCEEYKIPILKAPVKVKEVEKVEDVDKVEEVEEVEKVEEVEEVEKVEEVEEVEEPPKKKVVKKRVKKVVE